MRTLDISGGQGLVQFAELGLAFGLSALIGGPHPGVVDVMLTVYGRPPAALLAVDPQEVAGVLSVTSDDPNVGDD